MRAHLGYAARAVVRAPAFSAAVVLTLALGMGATATLFTVLDRLLLRPAELLERPDELRRIYVHRVSPFTRQLSHSGAMSYPDYEDLQRVSAFSGIAAYGPQELTLGEAGQSEPIRAELASANYFPLLGVHPELGRFYTEAEDRVDAEIAVAVLSDAFWQRRYGRDPAVLGQTLRIGKGSYTVVGVAPRGFTGVDIAPMDVWLPLRTAQAIQYGAGWVTARRWYWFATVARVSPKAVTRATDEATAVYRAGRVSVPQEDPDARIMLSSIVAARGPNPSQESRVAPALAALALLVLLIACANVANLLLARGVRRRRELAIQSAIGLGRYGLVAQLMLETVVLAAAGGVLAAGLTAVATPALFRTLLPDAALPTQAALRLTAFMSLVVVVVAVLAGVLPALRSTRLDVLAVLRATRESPSGVATRRVLLFAQAALCAVLLIGAGLFLRSLQLAQRLDMGVDTGALIVQFELEDGTRFGDGINEVSYRALERIRTLPGVAAAAVTSIPQFYGKHGITVHTARDTLPNLSRTTNAGGRGPFFYGASGSYFEVMGLSVLRGRALTDDDDRSGVPLVAVISASLARSAFAHADPIGQCLYIEPDGGVRPPCTQVVGVAEDFLPAVRADGPDLIVYLPPHHERIGFLAAGTVVALPRAGADVMADIRDAALAARSDIRMVEVQPLSGLLASQLRPWQLGAVLLTAFGILALLVAAAGIYSVLSFDVAQRRFEFGVRAALGGSPAALVRLTTERALLVCGAGVAAGMVAAFALASAAQALFFQISPLDPPVYVVAFGTLVIAIITAASVPAWRAVQVDPREALRTD